MERLVIATQNLGKFTEISNILSGLDAELFCLKDFPWVEDIEESGKTLKENALIKAKTSFNLTGLPSISDDTGMEIYALNMFPGIYSARCAGRDAKDRREFILNKMKNIEDRRVRFKCSVCFFDGDNIKYFEGTSHGILLKQPVGNCKFGLPYDSIFFHNGLKKTFSEATPDQKDFVSHRGQAVRKVKRWLQENF